MSGNAVAEGTARKRTPLKLGRDGAATKADRDPNYHYFKVENWKGDRADLNDIDDWLAGEKVGSEGLVAEIVSPDRDRKVVELRVPMDQWLARKQANQDMANQRTKGRGKRPTPQIMSAGESTPVGAYSHETPEMVDASALLSDAE